MIGFAEMTNDETSHHEFCVIRCFGIPSAFDIWHSAFRVRGFTIIELLVVIAIIIILAGLIVSTVGYVQKKGARSRTEAEIAAISTALESYKADNGIYPRDASKTDQVDPATSPISSSRSNCRRTIAPSSSPRRAMRRWRRRC